MYRFHYEEILSKDGSRAKLAYTDTDSLIYHIQTPEPVQRHGGKHWRVWHFDYPVDHPLHSRTKLLCKTKDECSSLAPQEFVGLRDKIYSILLPNDKPKFTAKGVSHQYILKHLYHKDYLRTLKETETTIATFSTLRSEKQQIKTIELTKKFLSAFDDKRCIPNDGITTIAYGHYKIAQINSA